MKLDTTRVIAGAAEVGLGFIFDEARRRRRGGARQSEGEDDRLHDYCCLRREIFVWAARAASVFDRPSAGETSASSQHLSRASNAGFPCFLNRFSFARTR